MHYNWLIAFFVLLVIFALLVCLFWNAGCPIIITGDCAYPRAHPREDRNHIMINGQLVTVQRPPVSVPVPAPIANTPPVPAPNGVTTNVIDSVSWEDIANGPAESVTEPFASAVTPCEW